MTEVVPLGARRSGARSLAAVPSRLAVMFNPTAGRRKAKRLAAALRAAARRGRGRRSHSARAARGDAERLARDAPRGQTLVVAGGDGTANEAANGLLAAGGGRLAIIPLGTANVLAAELGIETMAPAAPGGGEGRAAHSTALASPTAAAFVMMAGVGFDAHVVAGVSPRAEAPAWARAPMCWRCCASSSGFPFPSIG